MDEKKFIESLEELNMEIMDIKNSREYRIGCKISQFISALKKGDVKYLIQKAKNRNKFKRIKQIFQKENVSESIRRAQLVNGKKRVVVYSCITGGYDAPRRPLYYSDNIDYILYTDVAEEKEVNGWKIRRIPTEVHSYNNALINRYIKFHPQELFADEYEYSIYLDGNVRPISDLSFYAECVKSDAGIAMHYHSTRKCIEDEMVACEILKKGNYVKVREQVKKYFLDGFPHDFGMLECNVIVCELKNEVAQKVLREWWEELCLSQSGRDQIALPYILWKNNIAIEDVAVLGNSVYKNTKLQIAEHRIR